MNATLHLLVTLVLCTALVRPLAGARWVWRSPRTGLLLWQMLMLTWVLCAVGAGFAAGLAPYGRDIPSAFGRWWGGEPPPSVGDAARLEDVPGVAVRVAHRDLGRE